MGLVLLHARPLDLSNERSIRRRWPRHRPQEIALTPKADAAQNRPEIKGFAKEGEEF